MRGRSMSQCERASGALQGLVATQQGEGRAPGFGCGCPLFPTNRGGLEQAQVEPHGPQVFHSKPIQSIQSNTSPR